MLTSVISNWELTVVFFLSILFCLNKETSSKLKIYKRLPLCRFSVNVFQPPFHSGRTSPETSQSRLDAPPVPASSPEGLASEDQASGVSSSLGAGDLGFERRASPPESQAESSQASSEASAQTSLSTTRTKDSGFSESISSASCCSLDPHAEKETSCEKAVRPEGKKKKTHNKL